jgi:hypothetical protein
VKAVPSVETIWPAVTAVPPKVTWVNVGMLAAVPKLRRFSVTVPVEIDGEPETVMSGFNVIEAVAKTTFAPSVTVAAPVAVPLRVPAMEKLPSALTTDEPVMVPVEVIKVPPVKPPPVMVIAAPCALLVDDGVTYLVVEYTADVFAVASALVDTVNVLVVDTAVGLMIPADAAKMTFNPPTPAVVATPEFVMVTALPTTKGSDDGATPLMDTDPRLITAGTVVPDGKVTVTVPNAGTAVNVLATMVYPAFLPTLLVVSVGAMRISLA